jgi:hypothetical protein
MTSTAVRARLPVQALRGAAVAAPVAALAVAALVVARQGGLKLGPALDAAPDLLRGVGATLVLFGVTGYPLAMALAPPALRRLRHALALPLGAMASSLALTVLGFAHLPLTASVALVLAAGAGATLALTLRRRHWARVRGAGREGRVDWTVAGLAAVGALVLCLAVAPSLRAGFATVPGVNPDAHLVTGIAQLFEHAPPGATRLGFPVTHVPDVWKSKHPIFYGLAAVARLSGLDPVAAFPAVAGILCALVAIGFGLVARGVLGLGAAWATVAAAAVGLDVALVHLAFHPYWNQLWGLATLPYALLFAWLAVHRRDARALGLFGLTLAMGAFAYPLALPYPLVALAAFAVAERRLPPLPGWVRSPWALGAVAAAVALAIPLLGVWEKVRDGAVNLVGGGDSLWTGDVHAFVSPGTFVGVGDGWWAAAGVAAFAGLGLARALPRRPAAALAGLLALSALADVRLRLDHTGTYFDYKHLTFVAPVVLVLAVAGVAWLAARRRAAPLALAAGALAAYPVLAARQERSELRNTYEQVTAQMLALRHWSRALPRGASVRLDVPPTGFQLWTAYLLAAHPLDSPSPVLYTTYPHVAFGQRADYALGASPGLATQLRAGGHVLPSPPGRLGPVVFANRQFVLRRVLSATGPATATRARF